MQLARNWTTNYVSSNLEIGTGHYPNKLWSVTNNICINMQLHYVDIG